MKPSNALVDPRAGPGLLGRHYRLGLASVAGDLFQCSSSECSAPRHASSHSRINMNNNSSGSVPHRIGKRSPTSYERGSNSEMNKKLTEALSRLGDPVVRYRRRPTQLIKRNHRLPLPP